MKQPNKNTFHKLPILDGLEVLDAKYHTLDFPFHTHNTFNITLVIEQVFSTKISDRFLQAPAGTLMITNPEEVHATVCDHNIGCSFFTFYVSPDVLTGLNDMQPVFFENKVIDDKELFQRLYHISQQFGTDHPGTEKELLKTLELLVTKYAPGTATPDKKNRLFRKFLEEESFEKFSLENTANQFGLDKYKFLRLFKKETGLTPNNYIILKRIEKCKQLLHTQDDLLGIALETGFYDATHLCKHFKRLTGITPQAYRKA